MYVFVANTWYQSSLKVFRLQKNGAPLGENVNDVAVETKRESAWEGRWLRINEAFKTSFFFLFLSEENLWVIVAAAAGDYYCLKTNLSGPVDFFSAQGFQSLAHHTSSSLTAQWCEHFLNHSPSIVTLPQLPDKHPEETVRYHKHHRGV